MRVDEAAALIRPAVAGAGGVWADLGAGTGTFSRALAALLGPGGTVYAVDRDRRALATLDAPAGAPANAATVVPVVADFTGPLALPELDGALLANALHFVHGGDQAAVLGKVAALLRPGGALVLAEYDGRSASRWVPYPVSRARFAALASAAGLSAPTGVGERPSAYGGVLYAAVARRPGA
jgi:SAM-dependent methyltransferase